jgi:transcriptional regulator with XRE-family HTH domain
MAAARVNRLRLQREMAARGWNACDLARAAGLSAATLTDALQGRSMSPWRSLARRPSRRRLNCYRIEWAGEKRPRGGPHCHTGAGDEPRSVERVRRGHEPRFNPDAFERRLAMLGSRLLLGAVIGGAAVYFFDPVSGAERRSRLQARWEQHREPILTTAGQVATSAREGAAQLNDQATAKAAELKAKVQNGGAKKAGAV